MIKIKDNFRFYYYLYAGPDYQDEYQTLANRLQASEDEPTEKARGFLTGLLRMSHR